MGTPAVRRYVAKYVRVCVLSVSVAQLLASALAVDTTGTLLYRGWDTKANRNAANITVDSTATTGTVLTSGSIMIDPGDPATLDSFTSGIQFRFFGGTWNLPDLDSNLVLSQIEQAFYQADQPNGLKAPLTIVGASNYYTVEIEPDPPVITYQIPDTLQDWKLITDYATSQTIPTDYTYRIHPELGFQTFSGSAYGFNSTIAGALDVAADANVEGALTVDGNIRSYDGTIVVLTEGGSFSVPQVQAISILPGGIAGTNGGFNEDIHAGISGYANRSFVAGRGAQHFGHDGAFVLTTNGSGTAPYAGFSRMTAWNDAQGTRLQLQESTAPYRGSIADWLLTDSTFATSGSLETSFTLNIGSACEGQATIASGNTSILVNTSQITATDVPIIGYAGAANSGGALYYDAIVANTSFTIRSTGAVTTNTVLNWKVIH